MAKPFDLETLRWKHPDAYMGPRWPAYYVAAGRSRDSDAIEESNFRVTLRRLGGESGEAVIVVRERHWAVGWVEWVGVHESNGAGLRELRRIWEARESYLVLDDEDYQKENESRAMLGLTNCHDLSEEDARRVAGWCEENEYNLEGEDYAHEGVEAAKKALGIGAEEV
jgi:hypothetical protein